MRIRVTSGSVSTDIWFSPLCNELTVFGYIVDVAGADIGVDNLAILADVGYGDDHTDFDFIAGFESVGVL
jgi:hypothetical protein